MQNRLLFCYSEERSVVGCIEVGGVEKRKTAVHAGKKGRRYGMDRFSDDGTGTVTALLNVYGRVQGVGFRPRICRLAKELDLTGQVANLGGRVEIVITGFPEKVDRMERLVREIPSPAVINRVERRDLSPEEVAALVRETRLDFSGFRAVYSGGDVVHPFFPADIAICSRCLEELRNPEDRRYRYPYISCAECGPRYTIIRELPYDRWTTTMEDMELCPECGAEYRDLADRRCHGETISCHRCGPQLWARVRRDDAHGGADSNSSGSVEERGEEALRSALDLLERGAIIMVKATGGYNLVCRADTDEPVLALRELKHRPSKPFAVLFASMEQLRRHCAVSGAEEELLCSAARPIVLLDRLRDGADGLASGETCPEGNPLSLFLAARGGTLGAFLPSLGIYALLAERFPLVVTSCNEEGSPILFRDGDALAFYRDHEKVRGIFGYDRDILLPADDGVARIVDGEPQVLRRTRGYMPEPLEGAPGSVPGGSVLATGAQMEPSFCLADRGAFYPAAMPCDLENLGSGELLESMERTWEERLHLSPEAVVTDLHPGYHATGWGEGIAAERNLPLYRVQHHHAHALSVLAERCVLGDTGWTDAPVLAAVFDGTGYGPDGTVWGGEFLLCEGADFQRTGQLETIPMIGGDESMRQAWKSLHCHLANQASSLFSGKDFAAFRESLAEDSRYTLVERALSSGINTIGSSSMGRLFDAVAAFCGLSSYNSHQGHCAMYLEHAARAALERGDSPVPLSFRPEVTEDGVIFRTDTLWRGLLETGLSYVPEPAEDWFRRDVNGCSDILVGRIALGFHQAVIDMVADMCGYVAERHGTDRVVLSGGCFANRILLEGCLDTLGKRGFRVAYNRLVPPGDGGVSLGQAYYGLLREAEADRNGRQR